MEDYLIISDHDLATLAGMAGCALEPFGDRVDIVDMDNETVVSAMFADAGMEVEI
jgi:hypothetical protein